jgi:hypothetical protein
MIPVIRPPSSQPSTSDPEALAHSPFRVLFDRRRKHATHHRLHPQTTNDPLPFPIRLLPHLKVPKLDVLIRRSADQAPSVGSDVDPPDGPGVGLVRREKGRGGCVVQHEFAGFGADDDLGA